MQTRAALPTSNLVMRGEGTPKLHPNSTAHLHALAAVNACTCGLLLLGHLQIEGRIHMGRSAFTQPRAGPPPAHRLPVMGGEQHEAGSFLDHD